MRVMRTLSLTCMALAISVSQSVAGAEVSEELECASVEACAEIWEAELAQKGTVGMAFLCLPPKTDDPEESVQFVVQLVHPDSPADKAGVKQGDLILAANEREYTSSDSEQFFEHPAEIGPGNTVAYRVSRDNEQLEIEVEVQPGAPSVLEHQLYRKLLEHFPDTDVRNFFDKRNKKR